MKRSTAQPTGAVSERSAVGGRAQGPGLPSIMPLLDFIERAHAAELEAARVRAEVGMERAADHAERVEHGWRDAALEVVRQYAQTHARFLTEHVGMYVPSSADRRACGSIMQEASRRGWIRKDGYGAACTSNGTMKVAWASLILESSA